ncbi:MAG: D-alanyl-D-alanine carboxypeptidase family protein [Verrucomicrobiota bacterium]
MKKSNVTVIATILVTLHVLGFFILMGSGKNKAEANTPAPSAPAPTEPAPASAPTSTATPEPLSDFKVPEVAIPVEVVEMPPVQSRETIAAPGTREGYLRSDRPNRHTKKIYPKLTGAPYRGAIVVDARTGKILYENRATTYCYPASVTKLMTMLIVLEQIDAGVIHANDKVAISKETAGIGGSEVYLDVRESGFYTVDQLLTALMVHSANDAARALALHVAGSKEAFVGMMNQKARELGMNSTTYHSDHGLPPSGRTQPDISTPYDIAILSLAALRHPETLRYSGTKLAWLPKSPIRKEKFMLANRNVLVGKDPYQGCDGLKTGYHGIGGWSLAATAEHSGQRVISVVLGSPDKKTRNAISRKLLDKGFQALGQ